MNRLTAIVPMRGNSERVPRKNLRLCAGVPLYHHIVRTLSLVPAVDAIVVDTDCDAIAGDVARHFPSVRVVRRRSELCGGLTSMNDVLMGTLEHVQTDWVLQTHSTNPLLRPETVSEAISALWRGTEYDSLFSVTPRHVRLWSVTGQPLNHDPELLLRTQDLPPVLEENSCLYLFTPDTLHSRKSRIGRRPLLFEVDRGEAIDIDEWIDFEMAEALLERERRLGRVEERSAALTHS